MRVQQQASLLGRQYAGASGFPARILMLLVWILPLSKTALGAEPLLRFSLDDVSPSLIHVREGSAGPIQIPGRFGNALSFPDGYSIVARAEELDGRDYPVVSVTAWVRMETESGGSRMIFSNGSDTGPYVAVGRSLSARFSKSDVRFEDNPLPFGEWFFVAAIMDSTANTVRLHINDQVYNESDVRPAYKEPKKVCSRKDEDAPNQAYVMVGGHNVCSFTGGSRAIAIDEVRVYSGALSEAEVERIRRVVPTACRDIEVSKSTFDPARRGDGTIAKAPEAGSMFEPCRLLPVEEETPSGNVTRLPEAPSPFLGDLSCRKLPDGQYLCSDGSGKDFLCRSKPDANSLDCDPVESEAESCTGAVLRSGKLSCTRS